MQIRSGPVGLSIVCRTVGALAQDVAVDHIDDAATQGLKGLRNIRNHLDADPFTPSCVVRLAKRRKQGAAYFRP